MLIITGTSRGLGKALSETYSWPHIEALWSLTREHFDLEEPSSMKEYFSCMKWPMEPLHVIHLAAVSNSGFLHKQSIEDAVRTTDINLLGTCHLLSAFQPIFKERKGSTFTLISSVVVERPVAGTSAYAMSKGGVEALTRTAALEFSRIHARVNCLQLGYFDVGMIEQVSAEMQAKLLEEIPLHHFGTVNDLWSAWKFLMECGYVTGAIIPINGGLR